MESHNVSVPGIRELLLRTWDVTRPNLKPILAVTVLVHLPKNIVLALKTFPNDDYWRSLLDYYKINRAFDFWLGIIIVLYIIHLTAASHKGRYLSNSECFSLTFGNYWQALGASIVYNLACVVGVLLLISPGVFIAFYWLFYLQSIVIYHSPAMESFETSYRHVKGRWWRIFARVIVLYLLMFLAVMIVSAISNLFPDTFAFRLLFEYPADISKSLLIVSFTLLFLLSKDNPSVEAETREESENQLSD